ncbi:stalk domain-containing protein [Cohnella herbarum]|uniref:Copper amine oxidase-like N-terminal domain-containing protein n=1 Tax=Cohnella herbarum TaxID=2728023 RepID=A0A7Z2VJA0_9BACL|nr:hypothetical protein [Cohnella herbarum]QJD83995.1 hypothetical protein HH215_12920 [Cohnella herbarum]
MKIKSFSKYTTVFLAGAITATAGSTYAADAIKTIQAKLRPDIKVSVNGKQLDASAISYNNTTYLPLRKAADAVGGKIELDGTNINIVTDGKSADGTVGSQPSEKPIESTETYPIEGKVLYNWEQVYSKLSRENKPTMMGTIKNGQITTTYNDSEYIAIRYTDYFYDSEKGLSYYTKDYFLQFLSLSDIEELPTYTVKVKSNLVSPI